MRVMYLRYGDKTPLCSVHPCGVFIGDEGTFAMSVPGALESCSVDDKHVLSMQEVRYEHKFVLYDVMIIYNFSCIL
jgi:hypothetical protein